MFSREQKLIEMQERWSEYSVTQTLKKKYIHTQCSTSVRLYDKRMLPTAFELQKLLINHARNNTNYQMKDIY